MAKAEDIYALARYASAGNHDMAAQAIRCIAANEPANSTLKVRLNRLLQRRAPSISSDLVPRELSTLVLQIEPRMGLESVHLSEHVLSDVKHFLLERKYAERLAEAGLGSAHKLMLSGPPGNGKTTLAGAIALELGLPLLCVDFSTIVSSHLGETGAKIAKLFRHLQTPAVLFLDEMETLLSERAGFGNATDVGEVRRVVSTLLLEIDRLPEYIILIGATNHREMLDRAVVRRFDFHWELPVPSEGLVQQWLKGFAARHPSLPVDQVDIEPGASFSDIERQVLRWARVWQMKQFELEATAHAVKPFMAV